MVVSGSSISGRSKLRSARRQATGTAAVCIQVEVPFHDVDSLGVVWHGHYYKYLELARTALFRGCGLDARDFRGLGYGMVMIESRCRHLAPLRYADIAHVSAWFREIRHRIRIDYEIIRASDGVRAARAETLLATVTREGVLLLETPALILQRLESGPRTLPEAEKAPNA